MKQQTTGLLLCALLLSTFAHDHLRARQHAPQTLKHEKSHSKVLSRIQSRNEDDYCINACEAIGPEGDDGLVVIFNETNRCIGFLNKTLGIAIDCENNRIAVVDGKTGAIAFINILTSIFTYVKPEQSCNIGWNEKNQSYEDYINNNNRTWAELLEAAEKVGEKYSLSSIPQAQLDFISQAWRSLNIGSSEIKSQVPTILKQFAQSLISSVKQLRGVLASAIFKLVIPDLIRLANRLEGVVNFLGRLKISGGIQTLIEAGIKLPLALICNQNSGVKVFTYLGAFLQTKLNINAGIDSCLNPITFIGIEARLSGVKDYIIVCNKTINVLELGNSSNSTFIQQMLSAIINYVSVVSTSGENMKAVRAEWDEALRDLIKILPVAANSTLVQDLIKVSLKINGVNISSILHLLLQVGLIAALEILVGIILVISAEISLKILLPLLIIQLLLYFGSSVGRSILKVIFPGIQITLEGISQLIKKLPHISSGGIYEILRELSVFSAIIAAIEAHFKGCDLKGLLNSPDISEAIGIILKKLKLVAEGNKSAEAYFTKAIYFENSIVIDSQPDPVSCQDDRHLEHKLRDYVLPIHSKFQAEKHHAKELEKHHTRQLEKQHLNHISAKHLHAKHQTHEKLHKRN